MLAPMLRPSCDTADMPNHDVLDQLSAARARLDALRPAVEAREPWALAATFDHTPEAAWGPPELLAHCAEMVGYWDAELTRVATSDEPEPVTFGRIATDDDRLAVIRRERTRPAAELFDAIGSYADDFTAHWSAWSPMERSRIGLHPSRGEITVESGASRFIAGHLDEHAAQLEAILGVTPAVG